jgi:hypothetical protein
MAAIGGRPGAYTEPLIRKSIHYGCLITEEWRIVTLGGARRYAGCTIESPDGWSYSHTDTLEDALLIAEAWGRDPK